MWPPAHPRRLAQPAAALPTGQDPLPGPGGSVPLPLDPQLGTALAAGPLLPPGPQSLPALGFAQPEPSEERVLRCFGGMERGYGGVVVAPAAQGAAAPEGGN